MVGAVMCTGLTDKVIERIWKEIAMPSTVYYIHCISIVNEILKPAVRLVACLYLFLPGSYVPFKRG